MPLKITLRKSLIGYEKSQRRTADALGLGKVGSSVVQPDNEPIRGMVFKLKHVLDVENVAEPSSAAAGSARAKAKATAAPAAKRGEKQPV